jgi:hypothetical protein
VVLPLLLALLLHAAAEDGALGTYRVQATARLSGVPLVHALDLRGDVVLRPGEGPRAVRVRLAARGHACDLSGTLAEPGRLVLAAGQRCPILLDDPGVRGEVEASLRSGEARLADGHLVLSLEVALAGSVRLSTGLLPGLAREAVVPVDGSASVRGEGDRDNSRAADR